MRHIFLASALSMILSACGGSDTPAENAAAQNDGLTQNQIENGIGPIESLDLGPIDTALADEGEQVFTIKCSACHKFGERYVGPALDDVTERRTGAYVMNMILNPEGMVQGHPEAKKLFAEFMTPMANQNLTEDEARAVLEFLRTKAEQ